MSQKTIPVLNSQITLAQSSELLSWQLVPSLRSQAAKLGVRLYLSKPKPEQSDLDHSFSTGTAFPPGIGGTTSFYSLCV